MAKTCVTGNDGLLICRSHRERPTCIPAAGYLYGRSNDDADIATVRRLKCFCDVAGLEPWIDADFVGTGRRQRRQVYLCATCAEAAARRLSELTAIGAKHVGVDSAAYGNVRETKGETLASCTVEGQP